MVMLHDGRSGSILEMVTGRRTRAVAQESILRDYGIGAQILADLGVRQMELISNTDRTIAGLEGYGLRMVGRRAIELPA